jgi:hypothetical protein
VLARQSGEFGYVQGDAREIVAHQREHGRVEFPVRARPNMDDARSPNLRVANKGTRTLDRAQRPQYKREEDHRRYASVLSEA